MWMTHSFVEKIWVWEMEHNSPLWIFIFIELILASMKNCFNGSEFWTGIRSACYAVSHEILVNLSRNHRKTFRAVVKITILLLKMYFWLQIILDIWVQQLTSSFNCSPPHKWKINICVIIKQSDRITSTDSFLRFIFVSPDITYLQNSHSTCVIKMAKVDDVSCDILRLISIYKIYWISILFSELLIGG